MVVLLHGHVDCHVGKVRVRYGRGEAFALGKREIQPLAVHVAGRRVRQMVGQVARAILVSAIVVYGLHRSGGYILLEAQLICVAFVRALVLGRELVMADGDLQALGGSSGVFRREVRLHIEQGDALGKFLAVRRQVDGRTRGQFGTLRVGQHGKEGVDDRFRSLSLGLGVRGGIVVSCERVVIRHQSVPGDGLSVFVRELETVSGQVLDRVAGAFLHFHRQGDDQVDVDVQRGLMPGRIEMDGLVGGCGAGDLIAAAFAVRVVLHGQHQVLRADLVQAVHSFLLADFLTGERAFHHDFVNRLGGRDHRESAVCVLRHVRDMERAHQQHLHGRKRDAFPDSGVVVELAVRALGALAVCIVPVLRGRGRTILVGDREQPAWKQYSKQEKHA